MQALARRLALAGLVSFATLAGCSGGGGAGTLTVEPPPAPSGVVATPGNAQVTLSWPAVTGATSYNVYWSTAPGVTKANGTKVSGATSPYVHGGLANGTAYYYVVTAVNAGGESAASSQASAVPATNPAPAAPTAVIAAAGDGQVTLSWPAVTGATSYNVYWSTAAGVTKANGTQIPGVTSPYVHAGLANGTTHHYVVTAVNGNGESADSSEVSATPVAPPAAPTGVAAGPGNGQVTLSWSPVTGATSYNVYWSTTTGVTKANGTQIAGVPSPYVHGGLANYTTYYYVVTAVNAGGESAESSQASAQPSPSAGPPAAPTGVSATPGDGANSVSWNAVSGATSYNVYWSFTSGVTTSNGTKIAGASRPYLHTWLSNGSTYYYVVTAQNASGESAPSAQVSATPFAPGYTISGTVTSGGSGRVYLVADCYMSPFCLMNIRCGTSVAGPGPFAIRGVPPGTYTVRAYRDTLGHGVDNATFPAGFVEPVVIATSSVTGVDVTLTTPITGTPAVPSDLSVIGTDGAAVVQWMPNWNWNWVENVTGYDVAWGPDAAASTDSISLDARESTAYLRELTNGTYYFRIRARIDAATSAWSAPVGPVTIPPAVGGGHTVSGTVSLPVDATGPLYVLLYPWLTGGSYAAHYASPARSQPYTISGVQDGEYYLYFVVDQNRNGVIDLPDLKWSGDPTLVVTTNTTANATFPAQASAYVSTPTSRTLWDGWDSYHTPVDVKDDLELVSAVTIVSAKGLTVPVDLARYRGEFSAMLPSLRGPPAPGETIRLAVTYADGNTAVMDQTVRGLDFARDLAVTPTPSATVPTFSWSAPASPPAGVYGYTLGINQNGGSGGASWGYPSSAPFMPSGQLSVQYNADGNATATALTTGVQYLWSLGVVDEAGNSAMTVKSYTPQ